MAETRGRQAVRAALVEPWIRDDALERIFARLDGAAQPGKPG